MTLSAGVTIIGAINFSPFEHIFGSQYIIVLILYDNFAIMSITV
jgi:hypothetical protein